MGDLEHLAQLLSRDSEKAGVHRTFVLHLAEEPPVVAKDRSQDGIVTQRIPTLAELRSLGS